MLCELVTENAARLVARRSCRQARHRRWHFGRDRSRQVRAQPLAGGRISELVGLPWVSAQEVGRAREVQLNLSAGDAPLPGLECASGWLAARALGGDYHDVLDAGDGQTGLALGDISGKGLPAALMQAHLQGSLRSAWALGARDLPTILRSINGVLFASTASNEFATLFLGCYRERDRRLVYANCGHQPPLILRAGGRIDRLQPTGTVLGLFPDWSCQAEKTDLAAGDLVALFSDGVTEAMNEQGDFFGEERLIRLLQQQCHRGIKAQARAILDTIVEFGDGRLHDDVSVVLVRALRQD